MAAENLLNAWYRARSIWMLFLIPFELLSILHQERIWQRLRDEHGFTSGHC